MYCRRRFVANLIILAVFTLFMFSGCATTTDTFDPYVVPVFSTESHDLHARSEQIRSKLDVSGNGFFRISDIGALSYSRADSGNYFPIQITDEEAIRQAQNYLSELGLLPKDAYRTEVSRVNRSELDLTGDASASETLYINVCFYWVFNGVDVMSDQEDGILLSFDAQGIRSLQYFWRTIETTTLSKDATPISSEDAHRIFLEQWDSRHGTCCEPHQNPEIFRAYAQFDGVSRPCWVIAEDKQYTNAWFIDMFTGEVLYG